MGNIFEWFVQETEANIKCVFGSDDKPEPTQEERIEALEEEIKELKKK
jgi:hypothetical protein